MCDSSLPARIQAALLLIPSLPLKPGPAMVLHWLVRCAHATTPWRRFRVGVDHVKKKVRKSKATTDRYLATLRREGWIIREQVTRGARRYGWQQAWTQLTDQALEALGLQRDSFPTPPPKPSLKGNRFTRVRRIPADLQTLAARVGESRVVWLMSLARRAGRRLQEVAAAALTADNPVGFVMHAFRSNKQVPAATSTAPVETAQLLQARTEHRSALSRTRLAEQAAALRAKTGRPKNSPARGGA